jgi:hypothetical protein
MNLEVHGKQMKKKNTIHYYDGTLLCILCALWEPTFVTIVILRKPLERWVICFFVILAVLFATYYLILAFVATMNYKVTESGVEIYKGRKLRYFLSWEKVQSIGLYSNGVVISKTDRFTTEKLIGGSTNGPELAPWVFYTHYINSACYTKKRLAQIEDSTILLVTAGPSSRILKMRLAEIRRLWLKWKINHEENAG